MAFEKFNMNMDEYNKQLSELEANKEEQKEREFKDPTQITIIIATKCVTFVFRCFQFALNFL